VTGFSGNIKLMMVFNRNRSQVFTLNCGPSAMSSSPRSSSGISLSSEVKCKKGPQVLTSLLNQRRNYYYRPNCCTSLQQQQHVPPYVRKIFKKSEKCLGIRPFLCRCAHDKGDEGARGWGRGPRYVVPDSIIQLRS